MLVDMRKCIGCQSCTVSCSLENQPPVGQFRTTVLQYEVVPTRGRPPWSCCRAPVQPLRQPACVPVCPVQATFQREDGIVLVDNERCVGCAYCVQACPYDARFINHETQTADKCTFCEHRLEVGLLPACVKAAWAARAHHRRPERSGQRDLAPDGREQGRHQGAQARDENRSARLLHRIARRVRASGGRPGAACGWPPDIETGRGFSCRFLNCSRRVYDAAWLPWAVQYFFLVGISATTALTAALGALASPARRRGGCCHRRWRCCWSAPSPRPFAAGRPAPAGPLLAFLRACHALVVDVAGRLLLPCFVGWPCCSARPGGGAARA